MRKILVVLICLFMLAGMTQAQDIAYLYDDPDEAYQAALEAIEEARVSGATELFLERFGLQELPPEIGNLTNLQYIDLSANKLSSLPSEIGNLTSLQGLSLWKNQLHTLPSEIGNLRELLYINLGGNCLFSLPPEIGTISSLQQIDLYDNQLKVLPPEIGNLSSLQGINLDDNPLQSPPQEVVSQGTEAIKDYLRDQAAWHIRKMIAGAAGGVGVLAMAGLAIRWRLLSRIKDKKKR